MSSLCYLTFPQEIIPCAFQSGRNPYDVSYKLVQCIAKDSSGKGREIDAGCKIKAPSEDHMDAAA